MEVHRGTTRLVILTKHYAFKFPNPQSWRLFLHGLLGNMQEVQWWKSLLRPKYVHQKMCPVLFYIPGGLLVVMPRCQPISRKDFKKLPVDWDRKLTKTSRYRTLGIPVEHKQSSFGMLNGKVVAIDYGS